MKHTETINLQQLREEYKAKIIEFLNGNEVELKFDFAPFDIIVSMIEQILLELNYKADYDYVSSFCDVKLYKTFRPITLIH